MARFARVVVPDVPRHITARGNRVRAHLAGRDDGLVRVDPIPRRVDDFAALIAADANSENAWSGAVRALRSSERTGRPLGNRDFVEDLERRPRRPLAKRGAGRKALAGPEDQPRLL